jgi:hypothetical protein
MRMSRSHVLPERDERLLIRGAVVRGDGLFNAIELDGNGALRNALLIRLDGAAASKEAAAISDYGWSGELSVRRQRDGIRNRAIEGDPIPLSHRQFLLMLGVDIAEKGERVNAAQQRR